jgi:cell division protein FtsX
MSIAATATMVLMLVLLAGFWIIQTGLLSALDFTEQKVEVTANVQLDATRPTSTPSSADRGDARGRRRDLRDRDEALAAFQQSMKEQGART